MKKQTFFLLGIFAISTLACQVDQSQPTFSLNTAFSLKQGETIRWKEDASVQIRFDKVSNDSRCPEGVQCIWAGRAEVALTFFQAKNSQNGSLILGDPAGSNLSDEVQFDAFNVKLLNVLPVPKANTAIEPSAYVVELSVRKDN